MKTNFENIGGSYSQQGDYLFPNLTLSDENQSQIGVWGTRHRRYLKSSHQVLYYNLLTSGKLNNYLADVDKRAKNLFEQTVIVFNLVLVAFIVFPLSYQVLSCNQYRKLQSTISVALCER